MRQTGAGGGEGDGRDKMDQSAAFRKVRVKSVQKRKTEKEKEIKGIDSKEEKKYNVTSRHRHTIGNTQDQASLERGFPSTSSLIGTGLTVGETRFVWENTFHREL